MRQGPLYVIIFPLIDVVDKGTKRMNKPLEQAYTLQRNLRRAFDLSLNPAQLRASFSRFMGQFPTPEDVKFETLMAGEIPVEWMTPPGVSAVDTVFHLHGGGFLLGSPVDYREMLPRVALAAGAKVLAVDYRCSPENKCPTALNDAVAAYKWHLANGGKPDRTVIMGDSAGGGLVISTLVALREQTVPLPAAGISISPWVEMEQCGASIMGNADKDPMLDKAILQKMAGAYLQGQDNRNKQAAPLYADLSGLPPLLIQVGSIEILLDDSLRITERARAAGTEVELEVTEGAPHVWHWFASFLPEARTAIEKLGKFSRARMEAASRKR